MPDVKSAEKLLHEYEVEITTSFVMYYSCGVGKGKSKVRGAPQMNSSYERECYVEGCRSVGVMGRPRGGRDPKIFHKDGKLNLLFILNLISFFLFL